MDALSQALLALEAQAQLDGPTLEVYLRVAAVVEGDDPDDPTVYIDLCDAERRAVRVDRHGWSVVTSPPVRFRRPRGMHALPVPQGGGSLAELRQFVNLPGKRRWLRFLAWLLKAFYPPGPDPILAVSGEQGSAKSSLARVARLLIDPHEVIDRSLPKDIRDLMIAANGSAVLSFDNVSHLPEWFADALCRLSTGAAFATRELYTDADEVQFRAKRLVILNGIPDLSARATCWTGPCWCTCRRSRRASGRRRRDSGRTSTRVAPCSSGRCWTASSARSSSCRACPSPTSPGWPTSPSGARPSAAPRANRRGPSRRRRGPIAARPPRSSWTAPWWPGRSWRW